jgi:hypothetical protein
MYEEFVVNGSPAELYIMIRHFIDFKLRLTRPELRTWSSCSSEIEADRNPINIRFGVAADAAGKGQAEAYLWAHRQPDNKSHTTVQWNGSSYELENLWQLIKTEMRQQGFLQNIAEGQVTFGLVEPIGIEHPFDVVEAAVGHYLSILCAKYAQFKRNPASPARVVYSIHGRYMGDVIVRKLNERLTELSTIAPPIPYRINLTPEQFEFEIQNWEIPSLTDEQKREKYRQGIESEKQHYQEKLDEYGRIINGMLEGLKADGLFLPEQNDLYSYNLADDKQREQEDRLRGNPGLEHGELLLRLAHAQEAIELKGKDRALTWQECAVLTGWPYGWRGSGRKKHEDARARLERLQENGDPAGILTEVAEWRKKQERK